MMWGKVTETRDPPQVNTNGNGSDDNMPLWFACRRDGAAVCIPNDQLTTTDRPISHSISLRARAIDTIIQIRTSADDIAEERNNDGSLNERR
jgi:hypothetical protein